MMIGRRKRGKPYNLLPGIYCSIIHKGIAVFYILSEVFWRNYLRTCTASEERTKEG
jgi:hypothetical protein